MKTLSIILLLVLAFSCKPYRYLEKYHNEICAECIEEYVRDSITSIDIKIDTIWVDVSENLIDSTYTELYLQCDSNNQVLLIGIDRLRQSNNLVSHYQLQNGVLKVSNKVLIDSIAELHILVERYKKDVKIVESPPIIKKIVPVWVYICGGFLLLLLIILLILIIKK